MRLQVAAWREHSRRAAAARARGADPALARWAAFELGAAKAALPGHFALTADEEDVCAGAPVTWAGGKPYVGRPPSRPSSGAHGAKPNPHPDSDRNDCVRGRGRSGSRGRGRSRSRERSLERTPRQAQRTARSPNPDPETTHGSRGRSPARSLRQTRSRTARSGQSPDSGSAPGGIGGDGCVVKQAGSAAVAALAAGVRTAATLTLASPAPAGGAAAMGGYATLSARNAQLTRNSFISTRRGRVRRGSTRRPCACAPSGSAWRPV